MKTETEIAKRDIRELKKAWKNADGDLYIVIERNTRTHKAVCERWLDWIKEVIGFKNEKEARSRGYDEHVEKVQDLKQAIKLYDESLK